MALQVGATSSESFAVGQEHTALAMGNEGVAVLGTPALILFAETVCHQMIVPHLADGDASVGIAVNIRHLKATPVGMRVQISATLREIAGRRYLFEVSGQDEDGAILSGTHERAIVDLAPFLAKIEAAR